MAKLEIVNFSEIHFQDIPKQDNPAFGDQECIMITKYQRRNGLFKVLHIIPIEKPYETDSVNNICICYNLDNALKIAELFSNEK